MKRKLIMMLAAVLTAASSFALPEPAVWFKADTGVTVENGKVTAWANQGSLKSTLSAVTATNASTIVADNATFGTVLRFDGTDHLVSSVSSDLGISTGDTSGLACFIVCDFASTVGQHPGLFALWNGSEEQFYYDIFFNDNSKRMYAYFSSYDSNPLLFNQQPGRAGTIGKQALAVNANVGKLHGFLFGRKTDHIGSRGRSPKARADHGM